MRLGWLFIACGSLQARHSSPVIDLTVDDGVLKRDFVIRSKGEVAETWVLAIHMAVGVLSKNVANAWYDALKGLSVSSWHHTLRYRIFNQTVGSVQTWVPAVRADCSIYDSLSYNGSSVLLEVCFASYSLMLVLIRWR